MGSKLITANDIEVIKVLLSIFEPKIVSKSGTF